MTTHKQCLLGGTTNNVKYMSGHHLLYVAGGCTGPGGNLKALSFNFDYNCTISTQEEGGEGEEDGEEANGDE